MRYVLSKLNDEQLKELLSCFQTSILVEPIIQAPNNFKNLPRGFRITKLSLNQLTKIYFEEIKKDYDGCLAKYISNYMQKKFDDIGITELFESTLNEFVLING